MWPCDQSKVIAIMTNEIYIMELLWEIKVLYASVFGWPLLKRIAQCYWTVVLSVCLSCLWRWCTVAKRLDGSRWNLQAGRPQPWPHYVRRRPSSPSPKGAQPPIFVPYLLRLNGWMDQDGTWYGGRPRPRRLCWMGTPLLSPKKGAAPHKFSAHVYCGRFMFNFRHFFFVKKYFFSAYQL